MTEEQILRKDHEDRNRRTGRTTRACHRVAEALESSDEGDTIHVCLPALRWLDHWIPMLMPILEDRGIMLVKSGSCWRDSFLVSVPEIGRCRITFLSNLSARAWPGDRLRDHRMHGTKGAVVYDW